MRACYAGLAMQAAMQDMPEVRRTQGLAVRCVWGLTAAR